MLIKGFFHLFLNAASITGLLYARRVLKMLQMDNEYLRNVEVCESLLLCLKWMLQCYSLRRLTVIGWALWFIQEKNSVVFYILCVIWDVLDLCKLCVC